MPKPPRYFNAPCAFGVTKSFTQKPMGTQGLISDISIGTRFRREDPLRAPCNPIGISKKSCHKEVIDRRRRVGTHELTVCCKLYATSLSCRQGCCRHTDWQYATSLQTHRETERVRERDGEKVKERDRQTCKRLWNLISLQVGRMWMCQKWSFTLLPDVPWEQWRSGKCWSCWCGVCLTDRRRLEWRREETAVVRS